MEVYYFIYNHFRLLKSRTQLKRKEMSSCNSFSLSSVRPLSFQDLKRQQGLAQSTAMQPPASSRYPLTGLRQSS